MGTASNYGASQPRPRTSKNVYQYGAPMGEEQFDANSSRKDPLQQPAADPDPSPPADVVTKFHKHAAVDTRKDDIHHTLGANSTQAAPGDHGHTGGADGKRLLEGFVITGSKASAETVLPSIINALAELGATDSTT